MDRTFVAGVPADSNARSIVLAIIGLARTLDLEVIAEGIETPAQQQFLISNNCEAGQGFLYGKPMSLVEFQAWLLRKYIPVDDVVISFPPKR